MRVMRLMSKQRYRRSTGRADASLFLRTFQASSAAAVRVIYS